MLPVLRNRNLFDVDLFDRHPLDWFGGLMDRLPLDLGTRYRVEQREDNKNYYFDVELPRFKKEEVKVTVENGFLKIQAQRKTENEQSTFERYISLGNVKEDNVKANLEDGVLTVTLPKKVETKPVKVIDVE